MDRNGDLFKKGLHQTNDDFTSKEIQREEQALSNILADHGMVNAPEGFTSQLMSKLEGKKPKAYQTSVISLTGWIGIAAAFVGIVVLSFIDGSPSTETEIYSNYYNNLTKRVLVFFTEGMTPYYLISGALLFSMAALTDRVYSRRD